MSLENITIKEIECRLSTHKFAPVVPFHFYQQFLIHNYRPESILLLAHDVVAHPKEYEELFKDARWRDTTIFMDNSLVELKKAVDINMVHEAVEIVGPHKKQVIVICPDVMAEAQASANLTIEAWPEWSWKFKDFQKLVVIQGSNMPGFLDCAETICNSGIIPDWVSIPRVTENAFGYHRKELIPYISAIFPNKKIHLLGFSDFIWEDLRAAADYRVRSIDSAVPFRMQTLNILSEKVPPRGNWWETAKFSLHHLKIVGEINAYINRIAGYR